jgi:hypothetical protein
VKELRTGIYPAAPLSRLLKQRVEYAIKVEKKLPDDALPWF